MLNYLYNVEMIKVLLLYLLDFFILNYPYPSMLNKENI